MLNRQKLKPKSCHTILNNINITQAVIALIIYVILGLCSGAAHSSQCIDQTLPPPGSLEEHISDGRIIYS